MAEARAERVVRGVLRTLLRLYPSSFRREFGEDLVATASYRWRELVGRRGRWGAAAFWATEGVRFALDGVLERLHRVVPALRDDAVLAGRQVLRAPRHHGLAVLTLALGIGATASALTIADAVVFRPLPYAEADALYMVHARFGSVELTSNSMLNLRDLQGSVGALPWLAGAHDRSPALTDGVHAPERVSVLDVTSDYLRGLGARVAVGRPFGVHDFAAGAARVAIVSDALWRRRWGADPAIVGRVVRLDDVPHAVIGVMASPYRDPEPIESGVATGVWVPARDGDAAFFVHRDDYGFRLVGRLAPGATVERARAELAAAGRRLSAAHPEANRLDGADLDFVLHSLHALTVGRTGDRLLMLAGASVLLLLLACANAANLFLARGVARSKEFGVRSALGATRTRLTTQLFLEGLVTAVLAGAIGGMVSAGALRVFAARAPAGMPRVHELGVDGRALALVACVTAAAAVVFGVLPALRAAGAATWSGRASAPRSALRAQSALVVVEVALSLVLVAGSALLLQSLARMLRVPPGFDGGDVTVVDVRPPADVSTAAEQQAFYGALMDRARAEPGVVRAALAHSVPGQTGGAWTRATPDHANGSAPPTRSRAPALGATPGEEFYRMNPVSGEYFAALGMTFRAGRGFEGDPGTGEAPVIVLNVTAASRLFPGVATPLGRHVALGPPGSDAPLREVVGIVGDVMQNGAAQSADAQIYIPYRQRDINRLSLLMETADGPPPPDRIAAVVRDVAAGVPVDRIEPVRARYAATAAQARFLAALMGVLAAVGHLLAVAGTYATARHALSRRTRELAIRVALGARRREVYALALTRALAVAGLGIALGLALTLALARMIEAYLFGVGPRDPLTLAIATAFLAASVLAAAAWSARTAARVDMKLVMGE